MLCVIRKLSHLANCNEFFKPGGLNLSWSCLDRDSRSRHWQKVILDIFKKLVSTEIEISWFCLDSNIQIDTSQSRSRFIKTYRNFSDYFLISIRNNGFLQISHFFVYFFASKLASKLASKWAKSVGNSNFCFKNAKKVLKVSTKIEKSRKVMTDLKNLD